MTAGRADGLYLGWQFAPALPDPGAPPLRPEPTAVASMDPGWVAAQRRIAWVIGRPVRIGAVACALSAAALGGALLTGLAGPALTWSGTAAVAAGAVSCARSRWRGRRRLAGLIGAEQARVQSALAAESRRLAAAQRKHASDYRAWQRRKVLFDRQAVWFGVALPAGIDRVDVAGGTLAGWSALLTMIAAPRLGTGGEVTVVDLTEGSVAGDLISLAGRSGLQPLVWVLPGDLPRLDLGTGLDPQALADVLTLASAAAEADRPGRAAGGADQAADCALLERILGALGPDPLVAQVTAALRVLADIGDPRADVRSGLLAAGQVEQVRMLFGRGASERVVVERAFLLESRLRRLDALGAAAVPLRQPARLRVAALDRRAGVIGNRMIGTYMVAAVTQMLRQSPPGEPWAHTICLLGGERLGGDVLDRLADACEISRTGLVLAFRSIPAGVRERLGRGNAAIAFMRLGNGDDARAASDLIGSEHRFVIGQLTDTVGTSLTDTWGDSYSSTVGTSDSAGDSFSVSTSHGSSRGRGRGQGGLAPFGDFNRTSSRDTSYSRGESESVSLTEGVSSGTTWGLSTSRALGENASLGRTAQRSRELLVEPDELQRLPVSAMIVSYPSPSGRTVLLADANPAIVALPDAAVPDAALPDAALPDAGPPVAGW
ncbi:MAG TPA: hypothetical protein VF834_04410 [Streptosporangiaceae bacterium]